MQQEFYSNGKLLLSGEYAVLDGAEAWAMPTKFGQYLNVRPTQDEEIVWKSRDEKGTIWFECSFDTQTLDILSTTNHKIAHTLAQIFLETKKLGEDFLHHAYGFEVEAKLTFPKDWGLGSSSTLINNIAQWANVDAYELSKNTFGGSGYDIACAKHNRHILYKLENGYPRVKEIERFSSNIHPLARNIFFIYLNKKQNTRDAIAAYQRAKKKGVTYIDDLNAIGRKMIASDGLQDLELQMNLHEKTLSKVLGIPPVKERLFPDYFGAIKSLGAWGGDFIMATGNQEKTPEYFKSKGFDTVLSFEEMVLQ